MSTCQTIDLIMFSARALVLVVCALSGPYMIYLGVRMYREAVTEKSSGEVSGMGVKLVLKSAGPGLFLIAFGAGLLAFIVNSRMESVDETHAVAGTAAAAGDVSRSVQALALAFVPAARAAESASEPGAAGRNCVVQVRKRVFANGVDPLSRATVVKTLDAAIAALRRAKAQGIEDPDERAEVIGGLGALRQAAEETP